jgi:hypothetical protein
MDILENDPTLILDPVVASAAAAGRTELRLLADGRLLVVTDQDATPARLRLCFPWSEPGRHLSLRNDDDEEIAMIEDPEDLDPASRDALERALAEAGFVLEITRVAHVEEEIEIRNWTVETRQGRRTFQTHLDAWPRPLRGNGLLVRDVAGDLYRISDLNDMDSRSKELLWAFVD